MKLETTCNPSTNIYMAKIIGIVHDLQIPPEQTL